MLTPTLIVTVAACVFAAEPQTRPFEMGLIYWPPMGEKTPDPIIKAGIGRTIQSADHMLVQLPWRPNGPDVVAMATWIGTIAREQRRTLTVAVDWQDATRTALFESKAHPWSWRDASTRDAFVAMARQVAATYQPANFVLGVEANYHAHLAPESFAGFVEAYRAAREAVKTASPATNVLVTFQYEFITGRDRHWNVKANLDPVRAFGDQLDVLGVSVYPHLAGLSPGEVDAAYFNDAAALQLPVAIFETAWPSVAPWTAADQAEYARRVLDAAAAHRMALVVWTSTTDSMHLPQVEADRDQFDAAANWMRFLGLYTIEGGDKPAAATWRAWLARPRAAATTP